jgi:Cdc6-like AAA superfamily ATPase
MDRLSPIVTRLAMNERRHDLVMFHACAVADPVTGRTVVLYGPSGTGKTTMARTLCADLVYLSDETAGVTSDLRVVPYPKPLSIIVSPGDELKEQVSPGHLGLVRPSDVEYHLAALVQLSRDPEHAGDARVERLTTVDALPELVAQTSFTRDMERPLHRLADLAHQVGGVRRATYAEASQLRPVVRSLLDGDG